MKTIEEDWYWARFAANKIKRSEANIDNNLPAVQKYIADLLSDARKRELTEWERRVRGIQSVLANEMQKKIDG